MKKLIAIMACAAAVAGCNKSRLDLHWSFQRAIVRHGAMIQFETDTEVICTHSANVILIKDK